MNVGLRVALRLVPEDSEIAVHCPFVVKVQLLQSGLNIVIHRFLVACRKWNPFRPRPDRRSSAGPPLVRGCLCGQGGAGGLCTSGSQSRGHPEPRAGGQKGGPGGWQTQKSACKEGSRKRGGVSGQLRSALPSVSSCASAQTRVRTELGHSTDRSRAASRTR